MNEQTIIESGENWQLVSQLGLNGELFYSYMLTNPVGGVLQLGWEPSLAEASRKWTFERDIILEEWYS